MSNPNTSVPCSLSAFDMRNKTNNNIKACLEQKNQESQVVVLEVIKYIFEQLESIYNTVSKTSSFIYHLNNGPLSPFQVIKIGNYFEGRGFHVEYVGCRSIIISW